MLLSNIEIMEPIPEITNKYTKIICYLLSVKISNTEKNKMDVYIKQRQVIEKYAFVENVFGLFKEIATDEVLAKYLLDAIDITYAHHNYQQKMMDEIKNLANMAIQKIV